MKSLKRRSLALALAVVLMTGMLGLTADAAAKKTVKNQNFTTTTSTINKKATTVKKGTTTLTFTKGQGYVKFKAPSTKTYKFTFSNLTGKDVYTAFVEVQTKSKYSSKYSFMTPVTTKGGKTETLWLLQKNKTYKGGKLLSRPLKTRAGKIKLKKNQMIYFYFYNGKHKGSVKLNVK